MIHWADFRLFFTIACFLIFKFILAQDPKPPEAVDDVAVTIQGGLVTVAVLLNDIAEDGHPVSVVSAVGSPHGDVQFADSTVTYIPHTAINFPETDTIRYRIRDEVNGLLSGFGKITLSFLPLDFNLPGDTLFLDDLTASFNANGSWFYDYSGEGAPGFEVPLNSGLTTLNRSNFLIGGRRDVYIERVAGEHDYVYGPWPIKHTSDFWPGPFSFDHAYSLGYDSLWSKTWKVSREMVQWHREHWWDVGYVPPEAIVSWPGNGDPDKGQASVLAPFEDLNGNGLYEPILGEYPALPGDQAIYSMFNDSRTVGLATMSASVGVEVHQIAYAFDCPGDSVFNNSVFVRYRIINRSASDYTNLFCGIYTAFCIGNKGDEYMGCDTLLDCYFGYNDEMDEPSGSITGYGEAPPAQAICFLNHELHGFIGPQEPGWTGSGFYYELLRALWAPDGEPITYGGDGHGGTDTTTFLFPGDPWDPVQWSDYQVNPDDPGVRNGIGATGPFFFPSGDTIDLDIAYVFARDYGGTNLGSVELLKQRIETLRWYYDNDSTPCGRTWSSEPDKTIQSDLYTVFPNPCKDNLYVRGNHSGSGREKFILTTLNGNKVLEGFLKNSEFTISMGNLSPGVYILQVKDQQRISTHKIIKG